VGNASLPVGWEALSGPPYSFDTPNITWPTDLSTCVDNPYLENRNWPWLCETLGGKYNYVFYLTAY